MDEFVETEIQKIMKKNREVIEAELARVIHTEGKSVLVNEAQYVDPFWLGNRKLVRSPHIPYGTAYEFDPVILDFKGGVGT